MKREILTDDELSIVTGGAPSVQILEMSPGGEELSSPSWLDDIKSEMNLAELVPISSGGFTQKLKGIFQRMQLD